MSRSIPTAKTVPPSEVIRAAVVEAMAAQGVSQRELARRAGVSLPSLNRWLKGHEDATLGRIDPILEALEIKITTKATPARQKRV